MSTPTLPQWLRYANEPESLFSIMILHRQSITRDPGNADWYLNEIAEIKAHLRRVHNVST